MDRVMFLNASGAIVTEQYPYSVSGASFVARITEEPLPVVPFMEEVRLPAASVDTAALYGEHPENLATVTCSSGAALTFFCDSVAGGSDWSGSGSFDDPWRSLDKAAAFLSTYAATLRAAAPYIQLKIRGDTNYVSGTWKPLGDDGSRFILSGWSGRCDFAGARIAAEYFFDLRLSGAYTMPGNKRIYSNCAVTDVYTSGGLAVECELSRTQMSCAVNCSGTSAFASVLYGGSFTVEAGATYAYAPRVETVMSLHSGVSVRQQLSIDSAAVGAVVDTEVTLAGSSGGGEGLYVRGVYCRPGGMLANCSVNVSAVTRPPDGADWTTAEVRLLPLDGAVTVSGGDWRATALASTVGSTWADANALAAGLNPPAVVRDVPVHLVASAGARVTSYSSGRESEYEQFYNLGTSSWVQRVRSFADGVMTTSYVDSGSRIVNS